MADPEQQLPTYSLVELHEMAARGGTYWRDPRTLSLVATALRYATDYQRATDELERVINADVARSTEHGLRDCACGHAPTQHGSINATDGHCRLCDCRGYHPPVREGRLAPTVIEYLAREGKPIPQWIRDLYPEDGLSPLRGASS